MQNKTERISRYTDDSFVTNYPTIGRHIAVVGGGGKSTLSRAIAVKHGLNHVELDAIKWLPQWEERSNIDMIRLVKEAIQQKHSTGWVIDGNYFSVLKDMVIRSADTVIFVNMPWLVMFKRVAIRSVIRALDKRKICGENTESIRMTFMSRKSLLLWHIKNIRGYKARRGKLLHMLTPNIRFIELASPKQLNKFYVIHGLQRK